MSKKEQIEALRQHRIMAGFNRMLAPLPDISSEPVMLESIMVALSESHPLAAKTAILLKELAGEPLILFPSGARPSFIDKVWALCADESFEPNVAQEVGDAPTSVALVAAGFGLSLVPKAATSLSVPGVVYRSLDNAPNAVVDLSCIYRTDETSPILQAFLQTIREFRAKNDGRH